MDTHTSIENTTKVLKNVPTSNDIRYHLDKYTDINSLESDLNVALQSRLPDGIRQGKQKIAIDFNLIPYYGEPSAAEAPFIYRSQAKSGTCSFYAYATIYVIKKNKRVTFKEWSQTDCVSFKIMEEQIIAEAFAYDRHFVQAGYTALMRNCQV